MNKFNYILNDIAFDSYVIKCLYGYPTAEDIKICENQIKLLQQEYKQLKDRINKAIEYATILGDYGLTEILLKGNDYEIHN